MAADSASLTPITASADGPAQQPTAHIGGAKAMLQVHRRAQSVYLCVRKLSRQNSRPTISDSSGGWRRAQWACGGRWSEPAPAPVAWSRPCAASLAADTARAPALQQRCAPGCALRSTVPEGNGHVARSPRSGPGACRRRHVHPPATPHPGGPPDSSRWIGPAGLPMPQSLSQPHATYQPMRERNPVMCAV